MSPSQWASFERRIDERHQTVMAALGEIKALVQSHEPRLRAVEQKTGILAWALTFLSAIATGVLGRMYKQQ